MADVSVAQALAGSGGAGEHSEVTIKGWVRTRRDSKGGFSFLTVNDGSCFDSIQIVAPGELPNYQSEVTKITTGCSTIVTGKLVESQGKGQAYEIQATQVTVAGWIG
jgi:asparaginyl-tRNA synthetase